MSKGPNLLRVFYKGTEQQIKVFDETPEEQIIKLIKRAFHISEEISQIFLQDGDGILLCLPPKIPDGLCVYVYVEPSLIPSKVPNSNSDLNLLPGFKWDGTKSNEYGPPLLTNDNYTLGDKNVQSQSPVVSTQIYEEKILFAKFTIEVNCYQSIGIVPASYSGEYFVYELIKDSDPIIMTLNFFGENFLGRYMTLGILLNMNDKFVEFFWLENDSIIRKLRKSFTYDKVRIYACTKYAQITIQDGGSSPIPKKII